MRVGFPLDLHFSNNGGEEQGSSKGPCRVEPSGRERDRMADSTPDMVPMLGLDLDMEDDPEAVYGFCAYIYEHIRSRNICAVHWQCTAPAPAKE